MQVTGRSLSWHSAHCFPRAMCQMSLFGARRWGGFE